MHKETSMPRVWNRPVTGLAAVSAAMMLLSVSGLAMGQEGGPPGKGGPGGGGESAEKQEFPPFKEVAKDFVKVVSTADSSESLYTLYKKDKDQSLLAELPRNFGTQKHFWAMTVASGDTWAGLQGNEVVAYWKRYDKVLALIQPNFDTRSTGDEESRSGVAQQFTDRVLMEVPIVTMGPSGGPVIDLKTLLGAQAGRFFGGQAAGANAKLATLKEVKAFPENIEISIEMPVAGGQLRTFHYSVSRLPENTGYKPREADERVGYFTTSFRDLGKFRDDKKWVRYINRWSVEKRDPSLKMSPPKTPIVFYIDHKVPVRYRKFVRDGILEWNKAFEKVGIIDAIEVYYQDASTGANMDKDPEDVRYNFIRWLANDQGTAIGPSRTDPRTGQILDADVVLTDGWIRYFWYQANDLLPELATQGMSPQTLSWLEKNPSWDPRVRLATPEQRDLLMAQRAQRGVMRFGGVPAGMTTVSDEDGVAVIPQRNLLASGNCLAARGKGLDMALMHMHMELSDLLADPPQDGGDEGDKADADKKDEKDKKKKDDKAGDKGAEKTADGKGKKKDQNLIDGIPDWFVGPLLADLVSHEVGHTLGLRHNFKASSIYSLSKINSPEVKGEKAFAGSVMDYIPVNINKEAGPLQGDYGMRGIGPYDYWVIEYGYTSEDPKNVLKRVAEPELVYLTDEDVGGPDPLARPYDFAADPLDYAKNQMRLVEYYRGRLIDKFVKDGESWSRARRGYNITLSQQMQCLSFMAPWVGGAHVYRDRKGDPNGRLPIEVVAAAKQRAALKFVVDTAFKDEAFGLTPDLLKHMTVDKWADMGGIRDLYQDATFPVHERIMGIQATALTMLMNPTTLERVYDNEFRVPKDQEAITLPEVMNTISDEIWTELDKGQRSGDPRNPTISSLRRNLQREHLERLVDLTTPGMVSGAAAKPVSNLAVAKLREIRRKIDKVVDVKNGDKKGVDDYTFAHLSEVALRIDKVLDAQYIYNTDKIGGGGFGGFILFGQDSGRGGDASGQPGVGSSGEQLPPVRGYGLDGGR